MIRFIVLELIVLFSIISCKNDTGKELSENKFVSFLVNENNFPIVKSQKGTPIYIDDKDYSGVIKVAELFQKDIEKVTGVTNSLHIGEKPQGTIIIIGTIGKSQIIEDLIASGKLKVNDVKGKWDNSLIEVVENPLPNVDRALVIAGSDKRGTIYGMFDISRKMGVSPWYFWADVPVKKHSEVFIKAGRYNLGEPKVKYRGIFLNDEEPALGRWAVENYGGFNHQMYEHVFELILRLKGNFLWPAMWWASFNSDDPLNAQLADEFGIVMSTSHHEPLMRAHAEWKPYGGKAWNYKSNKSQLDAFWKEGIERMGNKESVVTLAMRGDGDEAMEEGTNIELLEDIVANQRKIIEEVTQKPANETPQVWALYKEVQEYYDKGMKVPDDVTLLFCDDNWGNVRVLPEPEAAERPGGYGMYYHFDYVGGPRNYKWLNTNSLPRVWEQLRLTYEHGVDRIWIVNVGDLKPMELPISFFFDYAWNPESVTVNELSEYTTNWASEQFSGKYAEEIAELLDLYTKYNRRRTPELLDDHTYSLIHYREFEKVVEDYNRLAQKAKSLYDIIDKNQKDAFYQLVYFPVSICANLNEMYLYLAKNKQYAKEKRAATNLMADKVVELFKRDSLLTLEFHTELADGKWNHMMAQQHIGYTYWNQPDSNTMPQITYLKVPEVGQLCIKIEGKDKIWTKHDSTANLSNFDNINQQEFYFELFNTGKRAIDYKIEAPEWLKISETENNLKEEDRHFVSVNWDQLPVGNSAGTIFVSGNGQVIELGVIADKIDLNKKKLQGFIENNGVVSIEAVDFNSSSTSQGFDWEVINGLGNTKGGVTSLPVNKGYQEFSKDNSHLEYTFTLLNKPKNDSITLFMCLAPTQDFKNKDGLKYAVSVDDEEPQIINLHEGCIGKDWNYAEWWCTAVSDNKLVRKSKHKLNNTETHIVRYWLIDPGIVLQKLMIDNGGLKPSYLGPPECKMYK
ncbi:glycosyl hydrolase 115 family protein [Labilibaculum sp.]|uniref:glycosyl hydrolase 115 family protein n=1 Tax=Labilibaculum sp. TaxID=2060723 RepID=UPI002AA733F5|nr:glycosyl hydrolase 115 family protein [Labilibaculum sp.]